MSVLARLDILAEIDYLSGVSNMGRIHIYTVYAVYTLMEGTFNLRKVYKGNARWLSHSPRRSNGVQR